MESIAGMMVGLVGLVIYFIVKTDWEWRKKKDGNNSNTPSI